MSEISKITLPNGQQYSIKDQTARNAANSAVPNTRTVNGKALSNDISLGAGDVGAYTKKETDTKINAAVASTYKYKGSVTADKLPTSGQGVGDVYNITNDSSYGKAGMNVAWNGTTWDALGSNVDLFSMTILSYGKSTWDDFITAYNTNTIVYCRASSNANPATGSQTRMAFMAYVNNGDNPTNVEFQYYRSVSSHSNTQQGDQVYVYKLDKNSGWSVIVRQAYTKVIAGTGLTSSYANGAITLQNENPLPTVTTTGSGNAVTAISASNGALTATKDATFATKQESLNHVVASKTQPSNQQAGDIWLIIK